MPKNQDNNEAPKAKGPRFLTPEMLTDGPHTVKIVGVPKPGARFPEKSDIPLEIEGQLIHFSVNRANPQWVALEAKFGPPEEWPDQYVTLEKGRVLKGINIKPAA